MLRRLSRGFAYHFPSSHIFEAVPSNVELYGKRVVKTVTQALRGYNEQRWGDVDISYNSNWRRSDGKIDISTCIAVHEALEREFKIEIDDKKVLIADV